MCQELPTSAGSKDEEHYSPDRYSLGWMLSQASSAIPIERVTGVRLGVEHTPASAHAI
jgi:hypothetical protein